MDLSYEEVQHRFATVGVFLLFVSLSLFAGLSALGMTQQAVVIYVTVLDGIAMLTAGTSIEAFDEEGQFDPACRMARIFFWSGMALAYAGAIAAFIERLH